MRIEAVTPHHLRVPSDAGDQELFLIELCCDKASGWGEARVPSPQRLVDAVAIIEPLLVGAEALDRGVLWERIHHRAHSSDFDASSLLGVLSAVDVALWDLVGQTLGAPCWQLAGGAHFAALDACAVAPAGLDTEQLVSWAKEASKQYFSAMRFDISADADAGVEAVHRARQAVGSQTRFIADAGSALKDVDEALQIGTGLAQADAFWCEDLLRPGDYADWSRLCREVMAPVAGGKPLWDAPQVWNCLQAGGVDILTPDLCLCGGLTGVARLATLARMYGVRVAVWPGLTPLSVVAAGHATLALPNALPLLPAPHQCYQGLLEDGPIVIDGIVELPEGPGLGTTVNRNFVEQFQHELPEADL